VKVSGGEKHALSIAALFCDGPAQLLVFDEADLVS